MAGKNGQLTENEVKNFITLSGERLVVATRQHWFSLAIKIIVGLILSFLFTTLSFLIFLFFAKYPALFISSLLSILTITISLITKLIADWYYHIYVVTTRRILEVSCSPFFSDTMYDVLLDQVRVTEIDVRVGSILHEFIDMGDVVIIFDRPSHEEKFILHAIQNPRQIGIFLCDALELMMHEMPVWFMPRKTNDLFRITEDIFPDHSPALKM